MRHVVSFSTGLSSAVTTERVIERYGRDNTDIVFMDTMIEDSDNYRFMADLEKRWGEIIKLSDGRDPYQVSKDAQIIPNQKIAPCTFALKIKLFTKWLETLDCDATIHIGFDIAELHRCDDTEKAYLAHGYNVDFPLLWKPYELRKYSQVSRDEWDIEPPRMYRLGYTHANCGGVCVKQGQGDWLRTLINFPDRYKQAEDWEQEMRDHPTRKDYALLRDQSGGEVKALTLREFRLRHEAQKLKQPSLLDRQSACFHCGVGSFVGVAA